MLKKFSGRGLVPDTLVQSPDFIFAVALGAALTSLLATKLGFPVSTTHALVGALAGAGWAGSGAEVQLGALGKNSVYPLLFSPVGAGVTGGAIFLLLKSLRLAPDHRTKPLDPLHCLSAGAASFARGLNDTPKMAARLLVAPGFDLRWGFLAIALAIALGALLDAERVAETLGKKVTDMNPGQGLAANLATAGLVVTASFHSLPVSTIHVSVGALLGIGVTTRQVHWPPVLGVLASWVVTLPCAALLAGLAFWVVRLSR